LLFVILFPQKYNFGGQGLDLSGIRDQLKDDG
jgi:hypothetical protein